MNISGLELPESLFLNSFGDTSISELEADSIGTAFAADLRPAATASMKQRGSQYEDNHSQNNDY